MKLILIAISFFFILDNAVAQTDTTFKLVKTITGDIVDFTTDNLGNLYLLSKDGQLKKLNEKGDSIAVFNDVKRYGKPYSLDASNPLKLLLYYKDFGTVVTLDRLLNARNTIDLRKQGIFQVKAISQSYDNGIWLYDEDEAKLKRLNDDGSIVDQSADFRLFLDAAPSPVQIVDQERLVYLYDPVKGLFVFDYYGTLKNKIALLGWEDFQVIGHTIFGRKNNSFERYELGTLVLQESSLPFISSSVQKVKIAINNLYCLKDGVINVYGF